MKKIYLFLFLIACGSMGFAQQFSITPADSVNIDVIEGIEGEATIYFRNNGNSDLTLVWDQSGNTLGTAWSVSICDNELCYFSAYPGDTMLPISGGQSAFLKFTCTIDPGDAGSGQLRYMVHAAEDTANVVEVTFNVNGIVSVNPTSLANQVNISPNPVSTVLTMRATTGKLDKGEAQVYDLSGKLLREVSVKGVDALDINVQTLPEGAYLLRYVSKDGVVTRRFLKTN
jgi:hypothetical protein